MDTRNIMNSKSILAAAVSAALSPVLLIMGSTAGAGLCVAAACTFAGVAWGLATGMSLAEIAGWASALSAIALESELTVSESVTADAVRARTEATER